MSYKNPSRKQSPRLSTPVRLGVAAVAACFLSAPVLSNPLNPTVVNGAASFNQAGNVLTVTNSAGAIINWQKFSIQAGETTHFAQASASSTVLNRVLGIEIAGKVVIDPTAIYGTLSSNGRVWLVNPAGIMVGPGGRVDVAAFVASTHNISNADFLAGRNVFINDGSVGNVINQGEIKTPAGGSVYLIGSNVTNEGIITTPKGETILAAGATVSLVDSATPGVKVDITGAEGNATNLGTITAEAGRIGIAGVIVRNSGTVNASSVVSEGGRVFLKASQDAYVDGNGRIVTTGTKGGSVEVLGNRVAVTGNAEIDASGTNGGGKIMVGGDYQGKNSDVQNANVSYFGPGATLKADATEVGDGGTVIVWADDTTRAFGKISARGGAAGGDGGLVETSGKNYLAVDGIRVDTRAPSGKTGNWLLDPTDIQIVDGPYGGIYLGSVFDPGSNSTITDGTVNSALGYSSVTIQTSGGTGGNGDITVYGGVQINGSGNALSLLAYGGGSATGNINISNASIQLGTGALTLVAGWSGTGTGLAASDGTDGSLGITDSMIWAGPIVMSAVGNISATGVNTGTWIQSSGAMDLQATNIYLTGGSAYGLNPFMTDAGAGVMLKSGGAQTVTATGEIVLQAGSANNTLSSSPHYGGSVGIVTDGTQTVSGNLIRVRAGASGHDNSAEIQAYGSQTINITGAGGLLEIKGGGSAGNYNNQARVQHGRYDNYGGSAYGAGVQIININGGGSIEIAAGSGTGTSGYYDYDDCGIACAGTSSSNSAQIENLVGSQTLNFTSYGSLTVTGGSAGTNNWAGVENSGTGGQAIYGSPNITLNGGSGGGSAVFYGGEFFEQTNDAGIYSEGGSNQYITAGTLLINGGNATYGGAGISNDEGAGTLQIVTTGDLSMYGGTSSAAHPYAAPVYIHSEYGGPILVSVGGKLHVESGSGSSAPAIIGSVDGPANVSISATDGVTLIANGSGVGIGALSPGYGATVSISSGGSITTSSTGSKGVLIGSAGADSNGYSSGPTSVSLSTGSDLNLGSQTQVGIANPGDDVPLGTIYLYGYSGINAGSAAFRTGGGSFTAYASTGNIALGAVNTDAPANSGYSGISYGGGAVTANAWNGTLSIASISAKGSDVSGYTFGTGDSGGNGGTVNLSAYGGLTVGSGGIDASGGRGGDGGEGSGGWGGMGGFVTLTSSNGNIAVNGNILAKGGQGGAGASGYVGYWGAYSGYQGGQGGQGGNIVLSANGTGAGIQAATGIRFDVSGGQGGSGGRGGSGYSYFGFANASGGSGGQGGMGGTINLGAAGSGGTINLGDARLDVTGGMGGTGGIGGYGDGYAGYSGAQGGWGGGGGMGGTIILSAPGSSGSINLGSAQLQALGGAGGTGGYGGETYYGYSSTGGSGGGGGGGGGGGTVIVNATGLGGLINIATAQVHADGGTGGQGGQGGYAYSTYSDAWGGQGGQGGRGGYGGEISLTGGTGGISMSSSGMLAARGGEGGTGGIGGLAVTDAIGYGGYVGNEGGGGDGGNYAWSAGLISLTSYGDIALSGTLDTSGGAGGSGAYTGQVGPGGSIVMIAGWYGGLSTNGTTGSITAGSASITTGGGSFTPYGGGSFTAYAGDSITLGTVNTDGAMGFQGGNVNMRADYGSLDIGMITARGGDGFSNGDGSYGGNVMLQSYGGLTIGSGGINVSGGRGGDGGEGGGITVFFGGSSGGNGGYGGNVMLTSMTGDIAINGSVNANGGDGGDLDGYGFGGGVGGNAGNVRAVAYEGTVTLTNVQVSAEGGTGGFGAYGFAGGGNGGYGGSIALGAYSGITLTNSSLSTNGGNGGDGAEGGGNGGMGGNGMGYGFGIPVSASVLLESYGAITLTNSKISANGGKGGDTGYGSGGYGGHAGTGSGIGGGGYSIVLHTEGGSISMTGATSSISANGGDGGTAYDGTGGNAGHGGFIFGYAYGAITMSGGSLSANGGSGGSAGSGFAGSDGYTGSAGYGGRIMLRSQNGIADLSGITLSAQGGAGGYSFGYGDGSDGGKGGQIQVYGGYGITLADTTILNVTGGRGGDSAYGGYSGGIGGDGGAVTMQAMAGSIALSGGSFIHADGGAGGRGSNDDPNNEYAADAGGAGGQGGNVMFSAYGAMAGITMGGSGITAAGGAGGTGGAGGGYAGYGGDGGMGGYGGIVSLFANGAIQSASVYVNGGAGGTAGAGFGVYGGGFVGDPGLGGSVVMTSYYGGSAAGSDAINAAVVGANSLTATVTGGAYGGIDVSHTGLQPATLVMNDSATSQGSINFFNSGDLVLDGTQTFATTYYGSKQIGTNGILSVTGGGISGYDLNLSGQTIDVIYGGTVTATNNIQLAASTINVSYGGYVAAGNNAALVTPLIGGTINLVYGGGVVAGGMAGTTSTINGIPFTGIGFLTQNLNASYGGAMVAYGPNGNISGLISGNVTLKDGAFFHAGDDIELVLAGSGSTVSLDNSHFLSDFETGVVGTIYLDFLTRSSGGVMIDGAATTTSLPGGSGFFVVDTDTPATTGAGGGLVITYANNFVVDPCISSPDLCRPPSPDDNPVIDVVDGDACATAPDSAQCKALRDDEKDKQEKDDFGDEEDGKRNEKSSQRKIAQCGI